MTKKTDIEKFIPELLPIEKSVYQQINDVKTTLIKMFVNRGFISKSNKDKYIEKLIKDENDELEYMIDLDNSKNYNTEIKMHFVIWMEEVNMKMPSLYKLYRNWYHK